jgi:ankyrin repeat protein
MWDGGWPPGYDPSELHDLARIGDTGGITLMLNNRVDVNARDEEQLTALHWAALAGHSRVVEQLCTSGARVNVKDEESGTPAHYAARSGHVSVLRALHRLGANMNAQDDGRATPAHAAGRAGQLRALLFLEVECGVDMEDTSAGTCSAQHAPHNHASADTRQLATRSTHAAYSMHHAGLKQR